MTELCIVTSSDEDVELAQALASCGIVSEAQLVMLMAADEPYLERKVAAFVSPHRRSLILPYCLRIISSRVRESSMTNIVRLSEAHTASKVSTGTAVMDAMLCGGLCSGHITEFVGPAGVGKTQLVLQMLVCAAVKQLPVFLFASESFPAQRLNQLAHEKAAASSVAAADVLSMIYIRKVSSVDQLCHALADESFMQALREGSPLIALDSVAALVGSESDAAVSGLKAATDIGMALRRVLSQAPSVACLVTNQVRASFAGHAALPALGLGWAQVIHSRIDLRRSGSCRIATVVASPHIPPGQCHYQIEGSGVAAHSAKTCPA